MDNEQENQTQDIDLTNDPRVATVARWFKEHPDQMPEKFRDKENPVQALLESYLNLEKKLGSGETKTQQEQPNPDTNDDQTLENLEFGGDTEAEAQDKRDFEWIKKEMATIGGKATEQVASLLKKKYNFTDQMVSYLEQSLATQQQAFVNKSLEVIGGKDNYNRLNEWLLKNRTKDEIARINQAVRGPDGELVLRGLLDLAGLKKNANPSKPGISNNDMSNLVADTTKPYASFAQVASVLRSRAFMTNTHPDHKRVVAEHQARAAATIQAGKGSILAGG